MKTIFFSIIFLLFFSQVCFCDSIPTALPRFGFDIDEPLFQPGGSPTADVLRKGEWLLSPFGWCNYGITNRLTILVDWLNLLGKIPAGMVRYQLSPKTARFATATDLYGFALFQTVPDQIPKKKKLRVEQNGYQFWLNQNITYRLTQRLRVHSMVGVTYDSYTKYIPKDSSSFTEKLYKNTILPEMSIAFEYYSTRWLKLGLSYWYGNTLLLLDQVPDKWTTVFSAQIAPFSRNWAGILSRMRIDFIFAYQEVFHTDFQNFELMPLISWQWGGEKKSTIKQ